MDPRKKNRLITLPKLDYTAGEITTIPDLDSHRIRVPLKASKNNEAYFIANEYSLTIPDDVVYHIPFILNEDGTPWYEANLFFYRQSIDVITGYAKTNELRRKASQLLDYKLFCEDKGIDFLDFGGRAPRRPSYRYFQHLLYDDNISAKNLNIRTLVVYDFYKFLAELPKFDIEISRVEKTKKATITFANNYRKEVELRSQTVNASAETSPVPVGFVRDEGEDLRPLTESQRNELIEILDKEFSVDERLIHMIALNTGGRKQSIFTLRMKHLDLLNESNRAADGTYMLKASPRTGMDTKFSRPQTLHFPPKLVEQLKTYAYSKEAKKRRNLFREKHGDILSDSDMYLFISTHGNCHYMAKNDPRFRKVKTRPSGVHTDYFKNKLFKYVSASFPKDFTFHWLRATYALTYYEFLVPLIVVDPKIKLKPGQLRPGQEIRMVQQRLHHKDREMTEHYLKLFMDFDEKMYAQEGYEERLFEGCGI